MNYDQEITAIVEAIKADKLLVQPYKNYAISDLMRVQAVVRMAKQTSNLKPPEGIDARDINCICRAGAVMKTCPIHGGTYA